MAASPRGDESALEACDEAAIATAGSLAAAEDAEVVAATVGPPAAEPALRRALAKGPDRAVRVWDDRLDEVALRDPQTKARLLAGVAADVDPDLVVTGTRSAAEGFGATGVTLAAQLGYGWATSVTDLTLDRAAGVVAVRRTLGGRLTELVDVELPAVLTIPPGATEPQHAGLGAVLAAHRATIDVYSLADLGCSPADVESPLSRTDRTERDGDATIFEGAPEETAAKLAAVLRANGVRP